MKAQRIRIFTIFLLIGFTAQIRAETKVWCIGNESNGQYACNVTATLNLTDSTLIIGGTGEIGLMRGDNPWYAEDLEDKIKSVLIDNGVVNTGDNTFEHCSNLTSVTMSNSVIIINDGAFSGCSKLTSLTISSNVIKIGYGAFSDCSNLTSLTIPNSVNEIGNRAFSNCYGLISVNIGNGVTTIGEMHFPAVQV